MIEHMESEVVDLIMDMHGNHVVQTLLMMFKASENPMDSDMPGSSVTSQYTQFIYETCMFNCVSIGMHKHGCCVMQRCLEKGTRVQKLQLADYIICSVSDLIEDPFGNYLVQNVLKLDDVERNIHVLDFIARDFLRLSQMKFSSNVIEKCINSNLGHNFPIDALF